MTPIRPAELGRWFDAWGPRLVLYARHWLDAASAEDVVQEVFLRLALAPPSTAGEAELRLLLFSRVRSAAQTERRSQSRRGRRERRAAADRIPWFEPRPHDRLDAESAQAALADLPDAQREVVVLRIWGGLTLREIADLLGEPISTVFSRYRAALDAVHLRLENRCQSPT